MKKFLLVMMLLLVVGCSKGEDYSCTINGKEAIFTLKDGIVTSYKLGDEKTSKSEIDEINGTYFTSATNNEEGKEAIKTYVSSLNGSCEF